MKQKLSPLHAQGSAINYKAHPQSKTHLKADKLDNSTFTQSPLDRKPQVHTHRIRRWIMYINAILQYCHSELSEKDHFYFKKCP